MRTQDELARTMALLPDNPNRVRPPDFEPERPDFHSLSMETKLDAAERFCRRAANKLSLAEALPESKRYDAFLALLLDSATDPAEFLQIAREMTLEYLERCAQLQGESLEEFA